MKWTIVRFLHDKDGEAIALLSVPEDMVYVTMGLVLGDVVNRAGAFHKHFAGSPFIQMDLYVTVAINIVVAAVVHVLSQKCTKQLESWRAAEALRADTEDRHSQLQRELGLIRHESNVQMLMLRHLALFSVGYCIQLSVAIAWLHWVGRVVAAV